MIDKPTFISLFAGIGGIDLGLERSGFECVAQVEWDEFCQKVLTKHWPEVPKFHDIKEVTDEQLRALGHVDLVAGGFPCQPVSLAGRQKGQADERWLWPEFARVIRTVRPRVVFMENVPGLLTANSGEAFGEVQSDLASLGYDTEWEVIPASAFGAPHLRKRVALVAYSVSEQLRHESRRLSGPDGESSAVSSDYGSERAMAYSDSLGRLSGSRVFRTPGRREFENGGRWTTEPDVGRVANGVPQRMDRLKSLGNAVVPQFSEYVGNCIKETLL